jgi:glutamate dehydrogenase/leucine dehydrogenase
LETELPVILVKPLARLSLYKTHTVQSKPKSVLFLSKGRTNLTLGMNQDGFSQPEQEIHFTCTVDNKMSETDVKRVKLQIVQNFEVSNKPLSRQAATTVKDDGNVYR